MALTFLVSLSALALEPFIVQPRSVVRHPHHKFEIDDIFNDLKSFSNDFCRTRDCQLKQEEDPSKLAVLKYKHKVSGKIVLLKKNNESGAISLSDSNDKAFLEISIAPQSQLGKVFSNGERFEDYLRELDQLDPKEQCEVLTPAAKLVEVLQTKVFNYMTFYLEPREPASKIDDKKASKILKSANDHFFAIKRPLSDRWASLACERFDL